MPFGLSQDEKPATNVNGTAGESHVASVKSKFKCIFVKIADDTFGMHLQILLFVREFFQQRIRIRPKFRQCAKFPYLRAHKNSNTVNGRLSAAALIKVLKVKVAALIR